MLFGRSPGGAGFGDPLERERACVERDVASGLLGENAAREDHGVIRGDAAATGALRERLRAQRLRESVPGPDAATPCARCGATQTLLRDVALSSLGEHFARCRPGFTLRERYCGGCATALETSLEPVAQARGRGG